MKLTKEQIKTKIKISCIVLGLIGVIALVWYIADQQYIRKHRTTFSSETEMLEYIKGFWREREKEDDPLYYYKTIEIKTDGTSFYWRQDEEDEYNLDMNYKRGVFYLWDINRVKFYIDENGDMIQAKTKQSMIRYGTECNPSKVEHDAKEREEFAKASQNCISNSNFSITNKKLYSKNGHTYCKGTVTNISEYEYKSISVKGSFINATGNVIDQEWSCVAIFGFKAGESADFEFYIQENSNITDALLLFYYNY